MYSDKSKQYYPMWVATFKAYKDILDKLNEEIQNNLSGVVSQADKNVVTLPSFVYFLDAVQVYVETPSKGAVFWHEDEDGTKYYRTHLHGVTITEVIGKADT